MPFDRDVRTALTGLAEGLLPLEAWTQSSGHRPPANASALPWRSGDLLTHDRVRTIDYLEWLIAASDADDLLLARWARIKQNPLAYCPLPAPRDFRESRGLSQSPRFATVEAGNSLADASGRQMSRRHLYDQCIPLLTKTAKDAERRLGSPTPPPSTFWTTLALELHRGNCAEWRAIAGAPQSTLLTEQLLRDVLTALLNGWLDVPPPWRYAVLIELGEFRKPGNAYTRDEVEAARAHFAELLQKRWPSAPAPEQTEGVRHATQWKSIP